MKKIFFTIGAALVLMGSCKKSDLELFPYNEVETTQAFNTEADVALAVNGMYSNLRTSGSYFVGQWNIFADVTADNLVLNSTGRLSLRPWYQWQYSSTDTYGLFSGGYTIARKANAILENIGKLPASTATANATGEALAIRAMTYFDMSRVYSKTYTNATDADLTVPYVTVTDATITPGKEPVKGFYDKVIADLVRAEGLINASNGVGRLNKAAVAGLLSRVYFYKGDAANTIAAAGRALGTTPNLPNIATFPSIWTDATEAGVLFKVKNTSIDNINSPGVNYFQTVSPGGVKSEYVVDYSFYQQFEATDVRKSTYISTSPYNGINMNHVIKYKGRAGQPAGVVDGKVIRTAEVLLNRMEAEYATAPAAALADLILLKSNRYTGYVPETLTGAPLLAEIQRQRILELAFEGDRFFDLKRRNAPVVRDAVHGENADGTGKPPVFPTLAAGDFRFNLPFPQTEINFNKNLTQNPGY